MTRLFWIALFLAAGFANSIPDAWFPPLPVMVALFMCCPACIWGAARIMNRANRVTKYSGTIQQGRYDDAGFPAQSYQGGVK